MLGSRVFLPLGGFRIEQGEGDRENGLLSILLSCTSHLGAQREVICVLSVECLDDFARDVSKLEERLLVFWSAVDCNCIRELVCGFPFKSQADALGVEHLKKVCGLVVAHVQAFHLKLAVAFGWHHSLWSARACGDANVGPYVIFKIPRNEGWQNVSGCRVCIWMAGSKLFAALRGLFAKPEESSEKSQIYSLHVDCMMLDRTKPQGVVSIARFWLGLVCARAMIRQQGAA